MTNNINNTISNYNNSIIMVNSFGNENMTILMMIMLQSFKAAGKVLVKSFVDSF